jgi:hypothetical protein
MSSSDTISSLGHEANEGGSPELGLRAEALDEAAAEALGGLRAEAAAEAAADAAISFSSRRTTTGLTGLMNDCGEEMLENSIPPLTLGPSLSFSPAAAPGRMLSAEDAN